jgi:hypothetical protein
MQALDQCIFVCSGKLCVRKRVLLDTSGVYGDAGAEEYKDSGIYYTLPSAQSLKNEMSIMSEKYTRTAAFIAIVSGFTVLAGGPALANTLAASSKPASLIITSDPLPESLQRQLYARPAKAQEISPAQVMGSSYYQATQTAVGDKVNQLGAELGAIQSRLSGLASALTALENTNESLAARYYSNVATINTQLQSGTTPGNPRLVGRLSDAEDTLEKLGASINEFSAIAQDTAGLASEGAVLLENTRAAYALSGAVEEDHVALAKLEDNINATLVAIERVLNTVNDDITRTSTYLSSETNNMRTLALGVSQGDLYGKSLSGRPFSGAPSAAATPASFATPAAAPPADVQQAAPQPSPAPMQQPASAAPVGGMRPLAKIRFDQPNVDYEQPVYLAVNEALQRFPDARFELVAVHPTQGNAAEVAIESTKARRNAEKVLRSLTQMGMPMDRIDLSYSADSSISANEVRLFIK